MEFETSLIIAPKNPGDRAVLETVRTYVTAPGNAARMSLQAVHELFQGPSCLVVGIAGPAVEAELTDRFGHVADIERNEPLMLLSLAP